MAQRGRGSAAKLAVVTRLPGQRVEPPEELTKEQAEEWRAVVATKPADWFTRDTQAMLIAYVKHIARAKVIAEQIDTFDPAWLAQEDGLDRYDVLARMADRESRAIVTLATKMRLTQQSRYTAQTAATGAKDSGPSTKPWEFGKAT